MRPRYKIGDRVIIDCSWSEANGMHGSITRPPDPVRYSSPEWKEYYRIDTANDAEKIVYWVDLARVATIPGQIEGGEFDQNDLAHDS